MSDERIARVIGAARRVCDERLLVHRARPIVEGRVVSGTEHAIDCPACALREALDALGAGAPAGEGAS